MDFDLDALPCFKEELDAMDKRAVVRRFLKGYLSLAAMIVFVLIVSLSKGAGWKAILVGMPVFLTFFMGITYQFVKELRALKRKGPEDEG